MGPVGLWPIRQGGKEQGEELRPREKKAAAVFKLSFHTYVLHGEVIGHSYTDQCLLVWDFHNKRRTCELRIYGSIAIISSPTSPRYDKNI